MKSSLKTKRDNEEDRLIGSWITDPTSAGLSEESEFAQIYFTQDGKFTYTIICPDKEQKMFLTYRVLNGVLITDQPSCPREEKTIFSFTPDGKLVLIYEGESATFIRYSLEAQPYLN